MTWNEVLVLVPVALSCFAMIIAQSAATAGAFALRYRESVDEDDLADALMRGRLDAAFMRPEERADELIYRRVIAEPFIVVFPSDHRLAAHDAIELREFVDETFLIPSKTAPTSRLVIEDYLKRSGLDIIPDHEVDNITHAVSMIASTGAVALLPAYPNNLLPANLLDSESSFMCSTAPLP